MNKQNYWRGLPFPSPGDLPHPEIEPESLVSPALQANSLPLSSKETLGFVLFFKRTTYIFV